MTEPHQPYRPRTPGPLSAGGFACAAVALIWLPVPFGLAGILLGVAAQGQTDEQHHQNSEPARCNAHSSLSSDDTRV